MSLNRYQKLDAQGAVVIQGVGSTSRETGVTGATPELLGGLGDCTVLEELAHAGHVEHGHAAPFILFAVCLGDRYLAVDVFREVSQHQVIVTAVKEGVDDVAEEVRIVVALLSGGDHHGVDESDVELGHGVDRGGLGADVPRRYRLIGGEFLHSVHVRQAFRERPQSPLKYVHELRGREYQVIGAIIPWSSEPEGELSLREFHQALELLRPGRAAEAAKLLDKVYAPCHTIACFPLMSFLYISFLITWFYRNIVAWMAKLGLSGG